LKDKQEAKNFYENGLADFRDSRAKFHASTIESHENSDIKFIVRAVGGFFRGAFESRSLNIECH
jgi:hypothetical protein